MSKPLVDEIMAALADFARRKLRVAVLRAPPGAKVFSAGHDVDELPNRIATRSAGTTRCAT